jgi:hypothetical protein
MTLISLMNQQDLSDTATMSLISEEKCRREELRQEE